ncbi:Txe/YoeB family addiction module toxin [Aurantimonas sp. HBX-1]|uniref:Txe/YoeB family addiction module toxin n=1 Tax=Aurantimonas sp. HBX-1 TaxID=2906072 RepID=UPI001F23748C|nr:Txe/YoeB family addiction module toxin [Aurantimonas sp. HBX-1]UIJ70747.1 Txe/YoeB family addiction module toxin [Aurantimonas sp. HBX-1]
MKLLWAEQAWSDYLHFQKVDEKIRDRINELIKETRRTLLRGIGKPEPLKGDLTGWWSRRITGDHRLVCRVAGKDDDQRLEIAACRYKH